MQKDSLGFFYDTELGRFFPKWVRQHERGAWIVLAEHGLLENGEPEYRDFNLALVRAAAKMNAAPRRKVPAANDSLPLWERFGTEEAFKLRSFTKHRRLSYEEAHELSEDELLQINAQRRRLGLGSYDDELQKFRDAIEDASTRFDMDEYLFREDMCESWVDYVSLLTREEATYAGWYHLAWCRNLENPALEFLKVANRLASSPMVPLHLSPVTYRIR